MAFILTEILIFLILCGLCLVLSAVWPPDSPWAPWWQMPEDVIKRMYSIVRLHKHDVVYDLGCGTGKALAYAAATYGITGVGIEIDPIRFLIARYTIAKASLTKKITLLKKNFFDVDISDATVIVVYLIPAALKRLAPKFFRELRPGTRFISYIYDFPKESYADRLRLIQHDKEKRIYVYELLGKAKK